MSPEEHYAEAERIRALAIEHWMNPEGGYDDAEPPTDEERATRAAVQDDARKDALIYLAEAQVHATLALYRPVPRLEFRSDGVDVEALRAAFQAGRRPQSEDLPADPSVTEKE